MVIADGSFILTEEYGLVFCSKLQSYDDAIACKIYDENYGSTDQQYLSNVNCSESSEMSYREAVSTQTPDMLSPAFSGNVITLKSMLGVPPCTTDIDGVVIRVYEDFIVRCLGELESWVFVGTMNKDSIEFDSEVSVDDVKEYWNDEYNFLGIGSVMHKRTKYSSQDGESYISEQSVQQVAPFIQGGGVLI
ncbi:hypothetical protein ADUPG1_011248 [Aduncisulcus paluster]|uniref:Uncharacterized protein n=2 Tax=Aduncisulcus paluster TaxID=2918883 RepID=A0ABQ5JYT9_9EUKA|nr:hypothetical protein ADUPG1_011248 [Aduncisulcus paluster]